MGLFHRKELPQIEVPYTLSIGSENTRLIVGLGNPGKKYDGTRHNTGFACLDAFAAAENGTWSEKKTLKSLICDLRIGSSRVLLCKPATYMNLSGEAVRAVQHYYKLSNQDTVVIYDELDIPFGQIRTKAGGGAAGHNGIKSLIQHVGEDFGRIRVGIGPKSPQQPDSAGFVLQKFSPAEQDSLKLLVTETGSIMNEYIFGGLPPGTRKFL
ncbi:MAG: aminoacyl-tRNA hydrolase [Candidatus Saccharimonadales bacterium]